VTGSLQDLSVFFYGSEDLVDGRGEVSVLLVAQLHPGGHLVGVLAARPPAAGRLVERHLGGVCGYIALGFLLGFMPVVFTFMGLAVEVRHVTLSAASLALCAAQAFTGAGPVPWAALAWGMAGIAGIGVLNFGVSFMLALRTAIDEGDASGIAKGNSFARIRKSLKLPAQER